MPPAVPAQIGNSQTASPFHAGERQLQSKNGSRERMEQFGSKVIRPYLPEQHRAFFAQLPFVVVGAVDAEGWPWASLFPGAPGFAQSPDKSHLNIALQGAESDPVRRALHPEAPLGVLGIEMHSRRRNRMNGRISGLEKGQMQLRVDQSFGNCPQYIQHRDITFLREADDSTPARASAGFRQLDAAARRMISGADVFFVASAVAARDNPTVEGVDVSHRGGRPGFVQVDGNSLIIPDFPGNNYFNTLGNFLLNPKAGLVFPDFETGDLLMLTGGTELLAKEAPEMRGFHGADRGWRFTLDHGVWLRDALPFRAKLGAFSPHSLMADTWEERAARAQQEAGRNAWRQFRVARVQQESTVIRSFYLEPADTAPLLSFEAGQFLTLRARSKTQGPGQATGQILSRSYTVSSAPGEHYYRVSVKREDQGQMSRLLHDQIMPGDIVEVKAPRGAFYIDPAETRPAVLLAGGVGITPMIAMANHVQREAIRTRHLRPLTVLHASQDSAQRAFADEFRALQQATQGQIRYLSLVATAGEGEKPGVEYNGTGRISDDTLRQVLALDDYDFFLCGPPPFMQGIYDSLRRLGVRDARIFAESFGPAALSRAPDVSAASLPADPPAEDEAEAADVSFASLAGATKWRAKDGSLLELAEAQGLTPSFSCRSGACGSCATRITQGSVSYRSPPQAEIPPGKALLCCARPAKGSAPLKLDL
ncbi:pyridoxamine 5'-phosphate oxidase family protein [Pseudophaeobacter arcticus]|uniref:2Fe-2S iron-sulfur cluster-binding protein n=1 Tax=Pseudophaeobacter arcticus TaxID=385492 RepID=UPI003A976748